MTGPATGHERSSDARGRRTSRRHVTAARERQSHVRHELRAPLAVIYPLAVAAARRWRRRAERPSSASSSRCSSATWCGSRRSSPGVADSGWADCSRAPARAGRGRPGRRRRGDRRAAPRWTTAEGRRSSSTPARRPRRARWADRDDVRQIVADLVRNAVTYTPGDGSVTRPCRRRRRPGTVTLEVADTGPGMPPEELARAFDFGFRGELARSLRVPGLGAGLWVCRELAARNGGSLSLAERAGRRRRARRSRCPPRPEAAVVSASRLDPARRRRPGPADGALRRRFASAATRSRWRSTRSPP